MDCIFVVIVIVTIGGLGATMRGGLEATLQIFKVPSEVLTLRAAKNPMRGLTIFHGSGYPSWRGCSPSVI